MGIVPDPDQVTIRTNVVNLDEFRVITHLSWTTLRHSAHCPTDSQITIRFATQFLQDRASILQTPLSLSFPHVYQETEATGDSDSRRPVNHRIGPGQWRKSHQVIDIDLFRESANESGRRHRSVCEIHQQSLLAARWIWLE